MFITFEGIDGSGKTTQINLLKDYLVEKKFDVLTLREPGGTRLSESIREILLNSNENISPITELLLFESARSHLVENIIKPALKNGKIVLCDRFYDSTTAYQGYGRGIDIEHVDFCNHIATGGLQPDITFYIHVDLAESKIRKSNKSKDRMENSGDDFYNKIIQGFESLSNKYPDRFIKIYSQNKIENTFDIIKSKIDSLLL